MSSCLRVFVFVWLAAIAGCAEEAPASLVVPPPSLGDVVEYDVSGDYVDLVRWLPELPQPLDRLRFTVEAGGRQLTSGLDARDTFAVRMDAKVGQEWQTIDVRHVALASNAVVLVETPFNATNRVLSWEEHGAPWLFGASALMGRDVAGPLELAVPASAGQAAALPLPLRLEPLGEEWRVSTREGIDAAYAWRSGSTWPETFRIALTGAAAGYAADFPDGATFEGRKVAETLGAAPLPIGTTPEEIPPPVAEGVPWDGRAPPERADGLVFPLRDAMRAAEAQDAPLAAWLRDRPDAMLYRATYFVAPPQAAVPNAPSEPTWNLGYVSAVEEYYEVKVARFAGGLPLARTYDSGPVEAPRGEHGYVDPATLPDALLPLDDAVARFQETFGEEGYEIFVRSFSGDARTPPGYYYLIDGGFGRPGGRYTTTWSAQTGRLESAVGPMETPG